MNLQISLIQDVKNFLEEAAERVWGADYPPANDFEVTIHYKGGNFRYSIKEDF